MTTSSTDFLDALARAGVTPESVDVVVNTHVHTDHVGWNTKRDGDSWVPTFPNARYLIPEADYRHFHPDNEDARPTARTEDEQARRDGMRIVWEDSVAPVDEAGQIELWSDDHQISESLSAASRAGTHARLVGAVAGRGQARRLRRRSHPLPMQLHRPMDPCAFDEDFNAAAVTRKRVLTEASRRRAAVIPAHYPGHGGATVVARGDGFMVDDWLEISAL